MRKILYISVFFLMFLPQTVLAQFYVTGDDPGRLRWRLVETENYRIIYPEGTDSLARVYGTELERYRRALSRSSGYLPGGGFGTRMPVVLHAYNGANGSVAWAPKRMDLFTLPSAYDPEPVPWSRQLAIHEGRHVSQMQFGMTKALKPGNFIFGQMWNIAVSLLYPGIAFMEGDAVIAETAYTPSGRGRVADFMNYYRVAFDNGKFRKWHQWMFASQRNYSPTYYALGYMTVGGFRYLYDCPEYMDKAYHNVARRPYNFGKFHSMVEEYSGKNFQDSFLEVCDTLHSLWRKDAQERAPFICSEQVCIEPELYTDYQNGIAGRDGLYYVKQGHLSSPAVVRIGKDGKEKFVSHIAHESGNLRADRWGNIYWSEAKPDERWSLKAESRIKVHDGGKTRTMATGLIYNPCPDPEGFRIAVAEYDVKGGTAVCIYENRKGGSKISDYPAPDSLQVVEVVWFKEDQIMATAVSDNGYGIYRLSPGSGKWDVVSPPVPAMIRDLTCRGDVLAFTCDRTGVNEVYEFDPVTGRAIQKTCTHYGASDFVYKDSHLYYTSQTLKGKLLFRTPVDSLLNRTVDLGQLHQYPIAEKLAAQEKELATGRSEALTDTCTVRFSTPKRYSKAANSLTVHSWAPLYVSVDNIMNTSFERVYQAASLGVSGIIQNRLATVVGEIGYSAHKDPYNRSRWRHSAHAKLTYSGWYPVFELSVDFNDRAARQYDMVIDDTPAGKYISQHSRQADAPYVSANITSYIPFDFSGGGWHRGLVPRISYTLTNDRCNSRMIFYSNDPRLGGTADLPTFIGVSQGKDKNILRQYLSASIRGYSILSTPNSSVYPKWGIGAELGVSGSLSLSKFYSPMGYAHLYGYVPGFVPQQGLKFAATYQRKLVRSAYFGVPTVNTLPRGFSGNSLLASSLSIQNNNLTCFSFDYGIPVFIGDLSIGGSFLYIKRMVITPHFDFNLVEAKPAFFSAGAALTFNLESVVFITWPCSVGVTYSYNGGFNGSFQRLSDIGTAYGRHFVGPVFSVSF